MPGCYNIKYKSRFEKNGLELNNKILNDLPSRPYYITENLCYNPTVRYWFLH